MYGVLTCDEQVGHRLLSFYPLVLDEDIRTASLTALFKSRVEVFEDRGDWKASKSISSIPRSTDIRHAVNSNIMAGYAAVAI